MDTTYAPSPDSIRSDARHYNAEFPEAAELIAAGAPVFRLVGWSNTSAGSTVTVTGRWMVRAGDVLIDTAEDPAYHWTGPRRDGRLAPIADRIAVDLDLRQLCTEAEAAGIAVEMVRR